MKIKLTIIIALCVISINTLAANEIILPLQFSTQGFPIASIQIQGHTIPLIFDTGASRTSLSLSKNIVKKLNLKITPTNKKACFHDDTGKKTCLKIYNIPKIKIGQSTMLNVPCQLMDKLWGGHYDEGFKWFEAARNGVIGRDLLQKFNVLIDYKQSKVIFTKLGQYPTGYSVKKWMSVPFTKKTFVINAKINGSNVNLILDTGANSSIMKSTAKISVEKKSCASKNNLTCQYFKTKSFQIGGHQILTTKFVLQKDNFPFFDGLLGTNFFKKNLVFLDFKQMRVYFKPY